MGCRIGKGDARDGDDGVDGDGRVKEDEGGNEAWFGLSHVIDTLLGSGKWQGGKTWKGKVL